MLHALNPSTMFRAAFGLTFVIAVFAFMAATPDNTFEFIRLGGIIMGAASLAVVLLTIKPVLRFAHQVSFADTWCFPWLDGCWEGEIKSNWPIIKAMMDAAKDDIPPFDVLKQDPPNGSIQAHKVEVTIQSGLFDIEIKLHVPETTNNSDSVFARPQRAPGQPPRLYYVYKQTSSDPLPVTDVRNHLGAACLEYDRNTGELRGDYWTNRNRERGLNTAGSITLKRVTTRRRKKPAARRP